MSDDRRYLVTRSFNVFVEPKWVKATGYRHLERWLANRAGAVLHTRAEAVEVVARLQADDPDGYDFAVVALEEVP